LKARERGFVCGSGVVVDLNTIKRITKLK